MVYLTQKRLRDSPLKDLMDNEAIQWAHGTARVVLYPARVSLQKGVYFPLEVAN